MANIRRKNYERNVVETKVYSHKVLWLNEKHIGLDHKKLTGD